MHHVLAGLEGVVLLRVALLEKGWRVNFQEQQAEEDETRTDELSAGSEGQQGHSTGVPIQCSQGYLLLLSRHCQTKLKFQMSLPHAWRRWCDHFTAASVPKPSFITCPRRTTELLYPFYRKDHLYFKMLQASSIKISESHQPTHGSSYSTLLHLSISLLLYKEQGHVCLWGSTHTLHTSSRPDTCAHLMILVLI